MRNYRVRRLISVRSRRGSIVGTLLRCIDKAYQTGESRAIRGGD